MSVVYFNVGQTREEVTQRVYNEMMDKDIVDGIMALLEELAIARPAANLSMSRQKQIEEMIDQYSRERSNLHLRIKNLETELKQKPKVEDGKSLVDSKYLMDLEIRSNKAERKIRNLNRALWTFGSMHNENAAMVLKINNVAEELES